MKLHPLELRKPIFIHEGKYITLESFVERPTVLRVAELSDQDQRDLVLKRYEFEPKNRAIAIIGKGVFTIDELINEVKRGTEVGKLVVNKEMNWINFLVEKVRTGEVG